MDVRWSDRGLVPAIVQDARTGEVLMLAWMNAEALARTRQTGEAHFWSRSRQSLWHKGASSGNVQRVDEVRLDCDGDAILLRVTPAGPACHTGERSCFFGRLSFIDELFQLIQDRRDHPPAESYTARLFAQGGVEIAKKVGEEGVEVVAAALAQSDERLVAEAADLIYHLLVLLAARGLSWEDVVRELERRRR